MEAGVSSSLVELAGIGWAADAYRLCERDLLGLPHLRSAAAMACSMAGIREPRQLGFFELHDYSADAELLAMAALGLTRDDIERVNLSGGSMGGEAPFGGVLRKICDAFARLSDGTAILEDAGCARSALVQMSSGFAGQFQTVAVLRLVEDQL